MMLPDDEKWRRRYRRRNKDKIDPSLSPGKKAELRRFGWWEAFRGAGFWKKLEIIVVAVLGMAVLAWGLYLKGYIFIERMEFQRDYEKKIEASS